MPAAGRDAGGGCRAAGPRGCPEMVSVGWYDLSDVAPDLPLASVTFPGSSRTVPLDVAQAVDDGSDVSGGGSR